MVAMRAQFPLAAERWKAIQKIAVMTLAHAEKHGDAGLTEKLIGALPTQAAWRIRRWVTEVSPIYFVRLNGAMVPRIRKKDDPSYRSFDLERASNYPIFNIATFLNPLGAQFSRQIVAKEIEGKTPKQCVHLARTWFVGRTARSMELEAEIQNLHLSRLNQDLSSYTHEELLAIYSRCVAELTSSSDCDTPAATRIREHLFAEWRRRFEDACVDEYFEWPSTEAPTGLGRMPEIDSPAEGMLAAFGYHVGETHGLADNVRRLILDDVFSVYLPPLNNLNYMREWNLPASAGRLHKLADTLATLTKNEKRRGLKLAPEQREIDLDYLYREYYVGKFSFGWIDTLLE